MTICLQSRVSFLSALGWYVGFKMNVEADLRVVQVNLEIQKVLQLETNLRIWHLDSCKKL